MIHKDSEARADLQATDGFSFDVGEVVVLYVK
jgi:hypothetical protein